MSVQFYGLTHLPLDKMTAISQTTVSWMKWVFFVVVCSIQISLKFVLNGPTDNYFMYRLDVHKGLIIFHEISKLCISMSHYSFRWGKLILTSSFTIFHHFDIILHLANKIMSFSCIHIFPGFSKVRLFITCGWGNLLHICNVTAANLSSQIAALNWINFYFASWAFLAVMRHNRVFCHIDYGIVKVIRYYYTECVCNSYFLW